MPLTEDRNVLGGTYVRWNERLDRRVEVSAQHVEQCVVLQTPDLAVSLHWGLYLLSPRNVPMVLRPLLLMY